MYMKQVIYYRHTNGEIPINKWLDTLDKTLAGRIESRVARVSEGNMGDCKNLKIVNYLNLGLISARVIEFISMNLAI